MYSGIGDRAGRDNHGTAADRRDADAASVEPDSRRDSGTGRGDSGTGRGAFVDARSLIGCRHRLHLDAVHPGAMSGVSEDSGVKQRREAAAAHRESVRDTLIEQAPHKWVVIDPTQTAAQRAQATMAACEAGVDRIWGALLPQEPDTGRRGGCEILWRDEDRGGYIPVIVVNHKVTDPRQPDPADYHPLTSDLYQWNPRPDKHVRTRPQQRDQQRLAHLYRMLQRHGYASPALVGGAIGYHFDRILVHDLGPVLDDYDRRYGDRVAVVRGELPTIPSKVPECRQCPWWTRTAPGVATAATSAAATTPATAATTPATSATAGATETTSGAATSATSDQADVQPPAVATSPVPAAVDPLDGGCERWLIANRDISLVAPGSRADVLRRHGVETIDDLAGWTGDDPDDWQYEPFTETVVTARAWATGAPLVRRVDKVQVKRADVEVDVDLESFQEHGAYLWGTLLDGEYRGFVTWDPLPTPDEGRSFAEFWTWLMKIRADAKANGKTFAAYCYSRTAEDKWLYESARRFAGQPGIPTEKQIQHFVDGPQWVDMFQAVSEQFICPNGKGLKKIAPVAGFHWRDPEAGGEASMSWYRLAVGYEGEPDLTQRTRILEYNEDDVLATKALRDWMTDRADAEVPSIADFARRTITT